MTLACGVLVAGGLPAPGGAQARDTPHRYSATAVNMGSGLSVAGRVFIHIDRWSSARERERLLTAFRTMGQDHLLDVLQGSPAVGSIRLSNTTVWDLRYAFESALSQGGRRIVLATDRTIGFEEDVKRSPRLEYPFTFIEIRFADGAVGVGTMSVHSRIVLSRDQQSIELEDYATEPVRLTDVRIEP